MSGLIDEYVNESVTITGRGTAQADGTMGYNGASTVTKGWVRNRSGVIRGTAGREYTYSRIIYLKPDEVVALGDHITYGGVDHEVLQIDRYRDVAGQSDHIRCYVGSR